MIRLWPAANGLAGPRGQFWGDEGENDSYYINSVSERASVETGVPASPHSLHPPSLHQAPWPAKVAGLTRHPEEEL